MSNRWIAEGLEQSYPPAMDKRRRADLDDEAALVAAARRDPAAFGILYRRYATRVYRYLYSYTRQAADAEDLTAQVFMAVWEGLGRYREQGNFAAWLFSIVRNKVNDYYRRQRDHLMLDEASLHLQQDWDPLENVELDESLRRLTAVVQKLAPEQQELLRLRFAADLTYAQIAGILGKNEAAVKMAVLRLLRQLRAELGSSGGMER